MFAAIGQPLIACAPAKLAGQWFGENERVIATTIATASQPLGVAIGYVFPEIFVTQADSELGDLNVSNARLHIYQSLLWQAVVASVIWILCLIFIKEKPPTPPSASSES